MQILETGLPGVLLIKPLVFRDERGFFLETFNAERYANYGIPSNEMRFVQDNHSRSTKGTLRGLHFQIKHPQGKLVSDVTGHVLDVVADVCPDSPTFKQWLQGALLGGLGQGKGQESAGRTGYPHPAPGRLA